MNMSREFRQQLSTRAFVALNEKHVSEWRRADHAAVEACQRLGITPRRGALPARAARTASSGFGASSGNAHAAPTAPTFTMGTMATREQLARSHAALFGGARTTEAAPEKEPFDKPTKSCSKCGAQNELDAKKCAGCGEPFPEKQPSKTTYERSRAALRRAGMIPQ